MGRKVEEDESIPFASLHRMERIPLASKALLVHVRRAKQLAVEAIAPAVVRAAYGTGKRAFLLVAKPSSAVPAYLIKRS